MTVEDWRQAMTTNKGAGYAAMVAEAEEAVVAMKDPELRRVAFEKILATLLDAVQSKSAGKRRQSNPRKHSSDEPTTSKHPETRSRRGPKAYLEALIDDGFFKKHRTIAEVKAELANRGHHIPLTSLSGPLQRLTQDRRLRRQKIAANGKESKATYAYSNW
jgi:hypothetical protein